MIGVLEEISDIAAIYWYNAEQEQFIVSEILPPGLTCRQKLSDV
jgi:hypothetical protein